MNVPITTPDARVRPPIAAICALAIAAFGLTAPAASAGENESIKTKGGLVTFKHKDEQIEAWDNRPDHLGVQATLAWTDAAGDNHTKWVIDTTGADELGKFKDLSIRDGTRVALTMCYVDDTGPTDCSRPQSAVA
jgi:hypothetical protein